MGVYYANPFNNRPANDAEWQAMIQGFEAAFLASGFLEVAPDTGQINPLTVTRPVSISTFSGYRMYRAKDSNAASKPFYVKVEFGVQGFLDRPQVRLTMATGSNGAGTLTGIVQGSTLNFYLPSADGSKTGYFIAGGEAHSLWMMFFDATQTTHQFFLTMGRWLDQSDGSCPDGSVWVGYVSSGSGVMPNQYIWSDGSSAWTSVSSSMSTAFPDVGITPNTGGDVNYNRFFEGVVYRGGRTLVYPMLIGRAGELPYSNPIDSLISLNVWGRTRQFLPMPWSFVAGNGTRGLWHYEA